jgi:hypothetical protein
MFSFTSVIHSLVSGRTSNTYKQSEGVGQKMKLCSMSCITKHDICHKIYELRSGRTYKVGVPGSKLVFWASEAPVTRLKGNFSLLALSPYVQRMTEYLVVTPEKRSLNSNFASPSDYRRHPANLPTTAFDAKTSCRFEEAERHITFSALNISAADVGNCWPDRVFFPSTLLSPVAYSAMEELEHDRHFFMRRSGSIRGD